MKQIFHPRLRAKREKVQTIRSILRSLFFFVESLRIQRNRGNAIFSLPLFLLGLLLWLTLYGPLHQYNEITRSSWLNCALLDDEAVYWVSIEHYEAVAVGNWWYWVSRGHLCLFIYCTKWRSGRVSRMPDGRTHSQLWKIVLLSSLKSIRVELS